MALSYQERLKALSSSAEGGHFKGMKRGIEKESLRITPEGMLSQVPHPEVLGSALTHPNITTDYSEALLEFITPAYDSIDEALDMLAAIHHYTYRNIGDELLWVNSMPCILGDEESIPIARYGTSNIGTMKHVYRVGLWHRYGRMMQTIAGIHYNLSFPESFWNRLKEIEQDSREYQEYVSARYFDLIRNFQRLNWLALYLFGASPAVCGTFLKGKEHELELLHKHTWHMPYGTSLRMGDLGYKNNAQSDLSICYNALDSYIKTLTHAISTPHAEYEQIGVKVGDEYRQLNANILQIENEYYGSIRPKRNAKSGEKPTRALARGGVEYIELRCVDLDPFCPWGINREQALFLEVFATYCLLEDSPLFDDASEGNINRNQLAMVNEGRKPGLGLVNEGREITAEAWATELLENMLPLAEEMDRGDPAGYTDSIKAQLDKIRGAGVTTSESILDTLKARDISFWEFAMEKAVEAKSWFLDGTADAGLMSEFSHKAKESLLMQKAIEENDRFGFDDFLAKYFNDELVQPDSHDHEI